MSAIDWLLDFDDPAYIKMGSDGYPTYDQHQPGSPFQSDGRPFGTNTFMTSLLNQQNPWFDGCKVTPFIGGYDTLNDIRDALHAVINADYSKIPFGQDTGHVYISRIAENTLAEEFPSHHQTPQDAVFQFHDLTKNPPAVIATYDTKSFVCNIASGIGLSSGVLNVSLSYGQSKALDSEQCKDKQVFLALHIVMRSRVGGK